MATHVYPVIVSEVDDGYVVFIPDIGTDVRGKTIEDAIVEAREAIGRHGLQLEDNGKPIPEPKIIDPPHKKSDVVALIDIDFAQFRIIEDHRLIHKNCTIPQWLNREAEARHINFSKVLQNALLELIK